MIEEIKIDINKIHFLIENSTYAKLFFTNSILRKIELEKQNNKTNLVIVLNELINNFYFSKKWYFFKVIDEFLLRGVEITSKKLGIVPIKSNSINCLLTFSNENRFKNIPFEKYGLDSIVEYFDINSDLFFNYILLDNFKYFNEELDIKSLENEFINVGFQLHVLPKEEKMVDETNEINNENLVFNSPKNNIYVTKVDHKDNLDSLEIDDIKEKIIMYILEATDIWLLLTEIADVFSVSLSNLKLFLDKHNDIILVSTDYVAHIDNIYITLKEEREIINKFSQNEQLEDISKLIYEERLIFFEKNKNLDAIDKVFSIVKYLKDN